MAVLKKKWLIGHQPCPYHANSEECPICDDPVCDCGNPGWACECADQENDEEDCKISSSE